MSVKLTTRQFEATPEIRAYVDKRVDAVLSDKFLSVSSVNVVMEREKTRFKVTVVVNCKYHVCESTVEDFELYKAFDAAADKIDVQLTKLREKIRTHGATPVRDAEPKVELKDEE